MLMSEVVYTFLFKHSYIIYVKNTSLKKKKPKTNTTTPLYKLSHQALLIDMLVFHQEKYMQF